MIKKSIAWDKVSQFEGPEESPGFLLWQVSTAWRRQVEAALVSVGLTHAQFVILASVGWMTRNDQMVTQIELARQCGTDVNMTSQVLRTLERKGYIERKQCKGNERSKFPVTTKNGRDLIIKAIPLVEEVDKKFFLMLENEDKLFVRILQRLSEH